MHPYFIRMNYSLSDLPDSGPNPIVYMDISLKGEGIGRLLIRLFRNVFPAGVENFIKIANGCTYRVVTHGKGVYSYCRQTKRTYEGCRFFHFSHNNYIICGDIYNNNGSNSGTIFGDKPIPPSFGEYYYPHERKGLISLVPYRDQATGQLFYDSTFMITLDDAKPSNVLSELDHDQIVIGQVYEGLDILDRMNTLIKPYARRKYPVFVISASGEPRRGRVIPGALRLKARRFIKEPKPLALSENISENISEDIIE